VTGNIGYKNSNRGQATLLSGNTSTIFSHNLNATPNTYDILLSPLTSAALSGISSYWVTATTATTITVTVNTAATSNFYFVWDAKTAGAQ
jgi:hypothetical protein